MQTNEMTIEMLNDLIKINNDRIVGYEKAIEEAKGKEQDLKTIFEKMIGESTAYKNELVEKAEALGDENVADETTVTGDIYRAWMEIKSTFKDDPDTILDSCEFGEDAWRRAYENALAQEDIDPEVKNLIQRQYEAEKPSHDLIKQKRNLHH